MLVEQYLPAIRQIFSEFFIFQQDSAVARRTRRAQAINCSSAT